MKIPEMSGNGSVNLEVNNSEEDLVKILMVPILKMMAYLIKKRVVSNLMLSTKH